MEETINELKYSGSALYNKENLLEFGFKYYYNNGRFFFWLLLLGTFFVITSLLLNLNSEEFPWVVFICGFILLFLIPFCYFTLKLGINTTYKRLLENNSGKEVEQTTHLFEKEIVVINPENQNKMNWSYNIIKKVALSKNLIIITSRNKQNIFIEKAKIDLGNCHTIYAFLKAKMTENNHRNRRT
ncbi:MAG: hypothetical protein FWE36_01065 [Erysipelotrichales bacterium]|nr:hypothetical protein [Erysipelotrichales bacterium]